MVATFLLRSSDFAFPGLSSVSAAQALECAGTTALFFMECADASALWKLGRVPVLESGDVSPHSK